MAHLIFCFKFSACEIGQACQYSAVLTSYPASQLHIRINDLRCCCVCHCFRIGFAFALHCLCFCSCLCFCLCLCFCFCCCFCFAFVFAFAWFCFCFAFAHTHTYTHVFAFAHRVCLRMLRIRPTPHDLALSKVVQHLPHRTFLRNCTKHSGDRGSLPVSSNSQIGATSCSALFRWALSALEYAVSPEWCDHNLPAVVESLEPLLARRDCVE